MTEQRPDWPALMRPETLRAYLDCRSDSDFARRMRAMAERGYPGMDPHYKRHIKAVVDQYIIPGDEGETPGEAEALRAISRFT